MPRVEFEVRNGRSASRLQPARDSLDTNQPVYASIRLVEDPPAPPGADGDEEPAEQPHPQRGGRRLRGTPYEVNAEIKALPGGEAPEEGVANMWESTLRIETGAEARLPLALPEGAEDVVFEAVFHIRPAPPSDEDAETAAEAETETQPVTFPADGEAIPIVRRTRRGETQQARAFPSPSIFDVIHDRDQASSWGGDPVEGVVQHVIAQLRSGPLTGLTNEAPYTPLPGELGEDDQPLSRLAQWQREAVLHLSGGFYSNYPRCSLQNLKHRIGIPQTAVCDNLVAILAWMRGVPVDNDKRVNGFNFRSGFGAPHAPPRDLRQWKSAYETWDEAGRTDTPPEMPVPPSFERLQQAAMAHGTDNGAIWNDWRWNASPSVDVVRPGSIFLWEGHIATVLRVRRTARGKAFQVFDTGGVSTRGRPPITTGSSNNCLQEQGWLYSIPKLSDPARVLCHMFVPSGEQRSIAGLPPLYRPYGGMDAFSYLWPEGQAGSPTTAGSQEELCPANEIATRLEERATAPTAVLAVFERSNGHLAYSSPPLDLNVTLPRLANSVSRAPESGAYEARWFVKLGGSWQGCHNEDQTHGRQGDVAVEIYNDAAGSARLYRMVMGGRTPNGVHLAAPAEFASRLNSIVRRRQLITPEHAAGSREASWDDELNGVAGGNPRGRAQDQTQFQVNAERRRQRRAEGR